jgi:CheY-like chemotaxis protein
MSLLGRLEDLSLTDIVQIVFLSRRTGMLEIIDESGRHTVLFRNGMIVNAASPAHPQLLSYLAATGHIPPGAGAALSMSEASGIAVGSAILDMNLMSRDALSAAIQQRIQSVIGPLLESREGDFNFILSDSLDSTDIEYAPEELTKEGGFSPQKLLQPEGGEKLKPLRGLEESLKAGKALFRGSPEASSRPENPQQTPAAAAPPESAPAALPPHAEIDSLFSVPTEAELADAVPFPEATASGAGQQADFGEPTDFGFASEIQPSLPPSATVTGAPADTDRGLLAAGRSPSPSPSPTGIEPSPRTASRSSAASRFRVAGGLVEVANPEAATRNVVLLERNPLIRVAARRAFGKHGVKIQQFGAPDDVRNAVVEFFRANQFFVTFLGLGPQDHGEDGPARVILQRIKQRNRYLPVVMIDDETDLRRRQQLLAAGADLYITKPPPARLLPGLAEQELALFAEELVLFTQSAFGEWDAAAGRSPAEAGRRFYAEGEEQQVDRSYRILEQLINELSNPNDITQLTDTMLRLARDYVDRAAVFVVGPNDFSGLAGVDDGGGGQSLSALVPRIRIPRSEPSILSAVADARETHRGKMRRTPANEMLLHALGGALPTEIVALPIMHEFKVIGILYGDNAENRAPIGGTSGLEIFLAQAGYAFGSALFASGRSGSGGESR